MNVPGAVEQPRATTRWLPLVLLLLALALYLPTVSKDTVVTDSQAAAASAWRIATTGRPWVEGVPTEDLEGSLYPDMWIIETPQGHEVHSRAPGAILPGVPFYWLLNNDPDPADFDIWVGGVAGAALTSAGGLLMYFALRPGVGEGAAFAGSAVLLFATPMWSVSANAMWTHNLTFVAIAGAMFAAVRSRWWLAGAFFALGILARAHLAIIAAVVGVYLGWRRRDWRIVAYTGATSALGLALLAAWNRAVFGSWSLRSGYSHNVETLVVGSEDGSGKGVLYDIANLIGFVLSPDRGFLVWTPVVLVLLPALLASWRQLPDWSRAFVLAGVAYSLVQLRINSFHGGQNFYGYRLALELLVCMTPALVYAYRRTSTGTKYVVGAVVGVQVAAFAIGAATERYYVHDAEMWFTSAYVNALADHPVGYGLFSLVCAVVGALVTHVSLRRSREPQAVTV